MSELPALRAAGAPRQDGNALLDGDRDRGPRGFFAAGHNDADRLDLIDRGVGRIARAARCVEHDLRIERLAQPGLERGAAGARKSDRAGGGVQRRLTFKRG